MSPTGPGNIEQALRESLGDDPTPSPQPAVPQKKKRPVKLIVAILSVILVIALGAAAFAYVSYLNSPEKALTDALNYAATNPGSYVYETDEMTVHARAKNNVYYAKLEDKAGKTTVEAIVTSGTIYIRSNDLAELLTGVAGDALPKQTQSVIKPVADSLKGGWVSMNLQSPALDLKEVDDLNCATTAKTVYQHDPKALKQTAEAYLAHQFLKITPVAGAPANTYSLALDETKTNGFLADLTTKNFYKSLVDCPQKLSLPAGLKLSDYKIDVSLDKDHHLQKATVTDTSGKKTTVSADYGDVADIAAPTNAVDVNQLLAQFLSSFLQPAGGATGDKTPAFDSSLLKP